VRVFCDHANAGRADGSGAPLLITYYSNPFERFFVAPFEMNYHAEHHLCPFVPHYNLPKLRALILRSAEHREQIQWRAGYLRFVLQYLRGAPGPAPGAVAESKSS
jgi:fatty acid desaturase